jgi:RNA polymerase sigma factor (sigma-70 family)
MATSQMSEVIRHLRSAVLLRDGVGLTDGQLLADCTGRLDEAALAALVGRHGPMVWGVCRRVLGNYHDAEDAFQATFLVLVRKGVSIASRGSVANWLYGVAHRTALKARATAAKRRTRERQVTAMPEPAVVDQDPWPDLEPLLDEELARLPDRYRAVVVLCDLEGKTRKEAAGQLGCPEGTVAGRLARARAMLARRLTQRGVALSGGVLAAVLSQKAASAGVPTSVAYSALKAAGLLSVGAATAGSISAKVLALTEAVMKAMLVTKLKSVMAITLALVAMVGIGAGLLGYGTAARGQNEGKDAAAAAPRREVANSDDKGRSEKDAAEKERQKLQGRWIAVSVEAHGSLVPEEKVKKAQVILLVSGDRFTATASGAFTNEVGIKGDATLRGTIKIDPTKQPGRVDLIDCRLDAGKARDVSTSGAAGIYELKGDTLTICYGPERPTEFKTKPNSYQKLYVFKREKSRQDKREQKSDERAQIRGTWGLVEVKCNGPFGLWEGGRGGKYKWVITDDSLTIVWDDGRRQQKYKVGLDPTQKPKRIDLTWLATKIDGTWQTSPERPTFPGIYELDGSRLKVHYMKGGGPRPTGFDFPSERGDILLVLKREPTSEAPEKRRGKPKDDKWSTAEKPAGSAAKREKGKEPEGFTAWGKAVGGLQAGLGFRPGEQGVYHDWGIVTLVVRVRNVGKKDVKFKYSPEFAWQELPDVTDAKGKPIAIAGGLLPLAGASKEVNLAAGKSIELYQWELYLRPESDRIKPTFPTTPHATLYGPGKFIIQYKRVAEDWSRDWSALSKLATGKLELEVKSDPPPAKAQPATPIRSDAGERPPAKTDTNRPPAVILVPPKDQGWPVPFPDELKLTPGTHAIRVTLGLGPWPPGDVVPGLGPWQPGNRPAQEIRLVSQTVEIVIQQGKAKKYQPEWGEAVQGARIRLRTDKLQWGAGEVPTFQLDLWNQTKQDLAGCRIAQACLIEVDGKWYYDNGPVTCPVSSIEKGHEIDRWLSFSLDHLSPYRGGDPTRPRKQGEGSAKGLGGAEPVFPPPSVVPPPAREGRLPSPAVKTKDRGGSGEGGK